MANCVCQDEYVVPAPKKLSLKSYEEFLKKFKYQHALLAVFQVMT